MTPAENDATGHMLASMLSPPAEPGPPWTRTFSLRREYDGDGRSTLGWKLMVAWLWLTKPRWMLTWHRKRHDLIQVPAHTFWDPGGN